MMLTARFKTCALAACLLTACLLLPDTQAKAESISLPEPVKASQTQPEAAKASRFSRRFRMKRL